MHKFDILFIVMAVMWAVFALEVHTSRSLIVDGVSTSGKIVGTIGDLNTTQCLIIDSLKAR